MYSKLVVGLAMASGATANIVRRDTGGGHDHGHSAPSVSSGYEQPAASYGSPAPSYGAPAPSYGAPAPSYGGSSSYGGDTGYGYGSDVYKTDGFDLTTILIPILIIFGLSLLFPTVTTVGVSGRRKREADDAATPMNDIVERVNDIYMSVVESEECMERIACEIGGLASDVGLNSIAKMADPFVPSKYKAYYKQFKTGQNCHKIKCGSIF